MGGLRQGTAQARSQRSIQEEPRVVGFPHQREVVPGSKGELDAGIPVCARLNFPRRVEAEGQPGSLGNESAGAGVAGGENPGLDRIIAFVDDDIQRADSGVVDAVEVQGEANARQGELIDPQSTGSS